MRNKEKHVELAKGFVWSAKQPKTILLTDYDENGNPKPEKKITL